MQTQLSELIEQVNEDGYGDGRPTIVLYEESQGRTAEQQEMNNRLVMLSGGLLAFMLAVLLASV